MAALLVAMALMALFMTAALPAWSQMAQREKETEYLFRANQYAVAIERCRRKQCGSNAPAPSVDFLVEQRYLRKRYKDPFTGKDFVPVLNNQALAPGLPQTGAAGSAFGQPGPDGRPGQPGQPGQADAQKPKESSLATAQKSLATDTLKISASEEGDSSSPRPLTGVTSSSKATALRLFKGQLTTYDQWAVTANDVGLHLGGYSVGARFATPGGAGTGQDPNSAFGTGGNPSGTNPFGTGGNPSGTTGSPFGGSNPFGGGSGSGSGFGTPGVQGTPVFPQPPASPFGSKPPF